MTTGTAAPHGAAGPAHLSHRQILTIFSGLMLGMLLASLDQTIVATALPTITGELGGLNHLSWVVTAYLLATTVSTPLYGKLGDLYGRKRLFQAAIAVFLVGSALCGLAQTMAQLIAFRAIQGLGGGGLIVLAQAIIAEVVSPRERGRYQGYFGAVFGTSSVAGPVLGGFLTDHTSWRWVFFVNLPLGALALVVTAIVLPASRPHHRPRVDYRGAVLLTVGVSAIVLLTTWGGAEYAWDSATIIGLGVLALVALTALVIVERGVSEPIVPVHLFGGRTFRVATSASFIIGVAMFGTISFLPLFLQMVNGASATNSGLLLMPLMLGLLAASMAAGQITSRTGYYRAFPIVGTAVATVAMLLLSSMSAGTRQASVTAYMIVLGVGIGLSMQTLVLAVQNAVPIRELGVATSSVSFFRSMGGSIGVALFGALFNAELSSRVGTTIEVGEGAAISPSVLDRLEPAERAEFIDGFAASLTTVFGYAVPLMLVAFAVSWFLQQVTLRDRADHAGEHPPLAH